MGSRIQNGIAGSGDFARNEYLSSFMAPSTAQEGTISTIAPMGVSCGFIPSTMSRSRLPSRGSPICAGNPHHRKLPQSGLQPVLLDYLSRAERLSYGKHTAHSLTESLGWHRRYLHGGNMRPREEN